MFKVMAEDKKRFAEEAKEKKDANAEFVKIFQNQED